MTSKQHSRIAADLFKERLKATRKQVALTQDQLVTKAEISAVILSKIETGVNRPTFDVLVPLAYALKSSANLLIGWGDEGIHSADAERRHLLMRLASVADQLSAEWLGQLISLAEAAKKS